MDSCTPLSRRRDSGDGRRNDTSLISIPDVAILLISINGLLPASPHKERLLTGLRQQGVWEREGMVVWLCACVRYGHDVVMCRVSIGFRCLMYGRGYLKSEDNTEIPWWAFINDIRKSQGVFTPCICFLLWNREQL